MHRSRYLEPCGVCAYRYRRYLCLLRVRRKCLVQDLVDIILYTVFSVGRGIQHLCIFKSCLFTLHPFKNCIVLGYDKEQSGDRRTLITREPVVTHPGLCLDTSCSIPTRLRLHNYPRPATVCTTKITLCPLVERTVGTYTSSTYKVSCEIRRRVGCVYLGWTRIQPSNLLPTHHDQVVAVLLKSEARRTSSQWNNTKSPCKEALLYRGSLHFRTLKD